MSIKIDELRLLKISKIEELFSALRLFSIFELISKFFELISIVLFFY